MQMLSIRSVHGGLLAAFAAAVLSASAASAEIFKAVIVGGVYQQTTTSFGQFPPAESACQNMTSCFVIFGPVPTGKQLIVTNVSCSFSVASGQLQFARLVPQRKNGVVLLQFQFLQAATLLNTVFTVNNTVLAPFSQLQRPLIQLATPAETGISSVACTISGRITDVTP